MTQGPHLSLHNPHNSSAISSAHPKVLKYAHRKKFSKVIFFSWLFFGPNKQPKCRLSIYKLSDYLCIQPQHKNEKNYDQVSVLKLWTVLSSFYQFFWKLFQLPIISLKHRIKRPFCARCFVFSIYGIYIQTVFEIISAVHFKLLNKKYKIYWWSLALGVITKNTKINSKINNSRLPISRLFQYTDIHIQAFSLSHFWIKITY